jgi:hypothetical protein
MGIRGGRLCRNGRRSSGRGNDGHLTTNEIGRQCRQSMVSALRPVVFDGYVVALDVTRFIQALVERRNALWSDGGGSSKNEQ